MMNRTLPSMILSLITVFSFAQAQTPDTTDFSSASNTFAFELLKTTANDSNQVFSPFSISTAFAMTYAGAANETAKEMEAVLGFNPEIHTSIAATLDSLTTENDSFELSTANALWGQEGHVFLDSFLQTTSSNYKAGLRQLDFAASDASRDIINAWVEEQTKNRIQNLLPVGSIDEYTKLVLTNAIYYKAAWLAPFQEQHTIQEAFTLKDGNIVQADTMRHVANFQYTQTDAFQYLELPYQGNETVMQIILPNAGEFDTVLASLTPETLDKAQQDSYRQRTELHMPKFEFEQAMDLKEIFSTMGMEKAFTDYQPANECINPDSGNTSAADFSYMDGTRCLYIGGAYHKAFIAVDESGTEAAAATAVVMMQTRMAVQAPPLELKLDRPFLFTIKHNETGNLLFVGTIMNPQQ